MPRSRRPSEAQLRKILRSARRTATAAAESVQRSHRPHPRPARRKGEGDFVTEVDIRTERYLQRLLMAAHPEHGFLGEEGGSIRPDAEFLWVVDPIDGTSNFAQGLPQYSVSVACLWRGRPLAAAVHILPEDQLYSAALGLGARRGTRPLRCPRCRLDDAAMIGVQWFRGQWQPELLEPMCRSGARIRVLGSTVVQLCDVAVGRLHANVQAQGRLWDIAAAGLIAEEAGARFTDWKGGKIFPVDDPFADRHYPSLAAPQPLHGELLRRLAEG